MNDIINLSEYSEWLRDLKQQIKSGQIKAAISVNNQMIKLYLDIGRQISEKQEKAQWGSGFIEQLSKDLKKEFPDMKGFSRANLFRMQKFYKFYSTDINQENKEKELVAQPLRLNEEINNQLVAQPVRLIQNSDFDKDIHLLHLLASLTGCYAGGGLYIFYRFYRTLFPTGNFFDKIKRERIFFQNWYIINSPLINIINMCYLQLINYSKT